MTRAMKGFNVWLDQATQVAKSKFHKLISFFPFPFILCSALKSIHVYIFMKSLTNVCIFLYQSVVLKAYLF